MSTEFYQEAHTTTTAETVTVSVIRGCFSPPGSVSRCGVIIHLFNGLDEDGQPVFSEVLLTQAQAQVIGSALVSAGMPLGEA